MEPSCLLVGQTSKLSGGRIGLNWAGETAVTIWSYWSELISVLFSSRWCLKYIQSLYVGKTS